MASDNSGSGEGWRVDTVAITLCEPVPCFPRLLDRALLRHHAPPVIMSESIKHTLGLTRLRNFILFMLLIAGAIATGPIVSGIRPRPGRCPPCAGLVTSVENFDSVTVPALPIQWLATNALGPPPLWVTSNTGQPSPPADTPPNAAFIDDPDVISDKRLDSMLFSFFEGCCPQLSFRHNFNLEASDVDPSVGFDGGVLELSTDGGNTFQEVHRRRVCDGRLQSHN